MIRRNVELEARLIDDLLDLTRIARGKLRLDTERWTCTSWWRSALDICRADARASAALRWRWLATRAHGVRGTRRGCSRSSGTW